MDYFISYGYIGLFLASFLAATILPLSSEIVLSVLLLNHYDVATTITVASIGNILGSITNYYIGLGSHNLVLKRLENTSREKINHSIETLKKFGTPALLFAWVPIIGDPLTVAAGFIRVKLTQFILFVSVGKIIRYYIVATLIINN
jgi:membrane protein YqaA with SNARE-associated domain